MECTEGHSFKVPWPYWLVLFTVPIMGIVIFDAGVREWHAKICKGVVHIYG